MKNFRFSFVSNAAMLLICFFMGSSEYVSAQKILSGDLKFLKGQTSLNVVFDFTNFKIEKETEAEYLARESEEINKKEAGKGDIFKANWEKDKTERFVESFLKDMKSRTEIPLNDSKAKYTLIVYNINLTNKGWGNKFSGGNPASMEVDFNIVETENQANSMCKLREEKARYMATTGTLSQKIQGCLEYAGTQIGKSIGKNLK